MQIGTPSKGRILYQTPNITDTKTDKLSVAINGLTYGRVTKDVTAWTKKNFRSTVASRRHAAYAEHKSALKRATTEAATP